MKNKTDKILESYKKKFSDVKSGQIKNLIERVNNLDDGKLEQRIIALENNFEAMADDLFSIQNKKREFKYTIKQVVTYCLVGLEISFKFFVVYKLVTL